MYSALRNLPDMDRPWRGSTYPEEWLRHYVERGYAKTDPLRPASLTNFGPVTWGEISQTLSPARRRIFKEAAQIGMHSGVGVPIHGPNGQCVGIGMAGVEKGLDHPETVAKMAVLCYQLHYAWERLNPRPKMVAEVRLTARETEILKWCSQGASTWQIGEILKISENSVEWHLKNIYDKLGVPNRTAAAVKALQQGLIF
jgi:DNA-binding CsgD family transcriptional regulator